MFDDYVSIFVTLYLFQFALIPLLVYIFSPLRGDHKRTAVPVIMRVGAPGPLSEVDTSLQIKARKPNFNKTIK